MSASTIKTLRLRFSWLFVNLLTAMMASIVIGFFAHSLEQVLKEHWGPDRFEAYRARFTPPAWLASIPQLPERDEQGRLPGFG